MTRQEFLQQIGLGAAFVLTVPCFHACSRDDDADDGSTPQPTGVDFEIDVTAEPFATDLAARDYTVVTAEKVVVARLADGSYAAASQVCSHQNFETVIYEADADQWFCQTHGALFDRGDGTPENDVTDNPLRIYTTTLEGNVLRVRA